MTIKINSKVMGTIGTILTAGSVWLLHAIETSDKFRDMLMPDPGWALTLIGMTVLIIIACAMMVVYSIKR